ncbi:MBL fold metallo-hydrolase [Roseomonas sp. CCTCC AB2023176]|uniref:MBL fold metallo-hydrolase n=1 Tax=Roseomonas sp. CCTCC AB2023176 TaxID=3342640 RepID=UPI0035DAAD6B
MERRSILAAGLAAPALLGTARAQTAAPAAEPTAPAFHRFQVGATPVFVLREGNVARPDIRQGSVVNASPEQVQAALNAAGITDYAVPNPFTPTAVQTRDGLVLIDAGFGQGAPNGAGSLFASMRAAGLDPASVRTVVFTHFHGDHVGGLLAADGSPAFPNATIKVPEGEWAFWNSDDEMNRGPAARRPAFENARRRFAPYAAKVERFRAGAEVAPGVTSVATFGHSPGHCSFLVSDGNQQALVIGDAVNNPALFMANSEWYPGFDMDPPTAVATRKALLDRAATERMPVIGYHFPMPATGRVERSGTGYRLVPVNA